MIAIIGAGLSGMSVAHQLKGKYTVLERENKVGGLCRSINVGGHTTDIGGGHILYTRDEYVKRLFKQLLGKNLLYHERKSYIYMRNVYVNYPFEVNLYGLPKKIIDECIKGVENKKKSKHKARNFHEWIIQTFGKGIAKYYMTPYNKKIWSYDLKKMSLDWIADRVPAPNVEDMKKGAKKPVGKKFGGNAFFHYPRRGGIQALSDAFSKNLNISLNSDVKEIKKNRTIVYEKNKQKKTIKAKKVFSSVPLPELIKMIDDVPSSVAKASKQLVYNSVLCFAMSINRKNVSDKHWIYYPESNIGFHRIIILSNFSPNMCPKNQSSIIVEKTYKKGEKIDIEKRRQIILRDLKKTDIVKKGDKIKTLNIENSKYAYIVYDLNHKKNVRIIHEFLNERGIVPIGRFGKWEYLNMDKSILDGKNSV